MTHDTITLIGAGLAGTLLSVYLAKSGYTVELYERRPDMRAQDMRAGRSINLAMSVRGFHALNEVGLKDKIRRIAIPMKGRMLHSTDGKLGFVPYGNKPHEVIYSVSRAELNKTLLDATERQFGTKIHFMQRCTGVDLRARTFTIENARDHSRQTKGFSQLIGTDGSASTVREAIALATGQSFCKSDLEHGYKELTIPAAAGGGFRLEKNALHIWPRKSYMLIALPNQDGSFTCTLFFPLQGEISFAALNNETKVHDFFEQQFPDAMELMPDLTAEFFAHPTGRLATIKCDRWFHEDKACLLGDAAHAIVPFFGQGINCGFEDCATFNACMKMHKSDWQALFAEFQTLRKPNTDAIAELSLANYFEMRDHVADPKFALKKHVEFALEERYPGLFIPRYSMVSFHRIPYAIALSRGKLQEKILTELCAGIESADELDWQKAHKLLTGLEPLG